MLLKSREEYQVLSEPVLQRGAHSSPQPSLHTNVPKMQRSEKNFYCPQQTSLCPRGEQLVQVK